MGIKGDTGPAGPRGYPGVTGLLGGLGNAGGVGADGYSASITDNGDGTFTIFGANGSILISDGNTPVRGVDYLDGNNGDYVTYVYCQVPNGNPVPQITDGTGSYDGALELVPTFPGLTWRDDPIYADGFTLYVSNNRYKHDISTGGTGTWSLRDDVWATPKVFNTAIASNAQFISYTFIRDSTPEGAGIPVGGDYNSPLPTTVGWEDGIPAGVAPVYMSKRLFTQTTVGQDSAWSLPKILGSSGSGTKLQFGPGIGGPWDDAPASDDEWMVSCSQNTAGTWVCDTANPVRIKGETGPTTQSTFKAYAFKRSNAILSERPTGGTFAVPIPVDDIVVDWDGFIPPGTANLYVSTRLFTTDGISPQETLWSLSELFSGEGAINFVMTVDSQVIAYDTLGQNPSPTAMNFSVSKQGMAGDVNWTTDPVITIAAPVLAVDTLQITAAEMGSNTSLAVTATSGIYTDTITTVRVQTGAAGPGGVATDTREVKFQFAPDATGSPGTWHSAPSLVTDDWMREATFYNDVIQGTHPTLPNDETLDENWSAGIKITGDDGTDVWTEFQFSAQGNNKPDHVDEGTNNFWSTSQTVNDYYVISRTVTDGTGAAWGDIVLIRGDDGVDGKYFETRYAKGVGAPTLTDNTVRNPAGWTTAVNTLVTTLQDEVIWAITAPIILVLGIEELDANWTAPVKWGAYTPVIGTDYYDGESVYVSRVFKLAADGFNTPPTVNTGTWDGTTEGLPGGSWSDDPMSPTTSNYVYMSSYMYVKTLTNGVASWPATAGTWSTPVKFAYIPTFDVDYYDGTDGDGTFTSFIYANFAVGYTPDPAANPPTGGTISGTPPSENLTSITAGWTDDPVTPEGDEVTWVSTRTYIQSAGDWQTPGAWGDPAVFTASTALTGILSNDKDQVVSAFNGTSPVFDGNEGGQFEVLFGSKIVTGNCTFAVAAATSTTGTESIRLTTSGLTLAINLTTGVYLATGGSWNTDKETFVLIATHIASGLIVTKKFTLTKTKTGAVGLTGTGSRLDIAYSTGPDGSGIVDWPPNALSSGKTYIGTNVVTWVPPATAESESTTPGDYEWSRIVGADAINTRNPVIFIATTDDTSPDLTNTLGTYVEPLDGPTTPDANYTTGWRYEIPSLSTNGSHVWTTTRYLTSNGASQTNWSAPAIYARRVDGNTITGPSGQIVRTVNAYRINNSARVATAGSFSDPLDGQVVTALTGWLYSVPGLVLDNDIVYVMTKTFVSKAGDVTADANWSTATIYAQRTDGDDAVNSRTPIVFDLRTSAQSALAVPSGGSYADPLNGNTDWSYDIPSLVNNGDKIYATSATFFSNGTGNVDFGLAGIYAEKINGLTINNDGESIRTVNLYFIGTSASAPAYASTGGTFADPDASNTSWSYSVPSITANLQYVHVMTRTFSDAGAGTTQDANWSAPTVYAYRKDGSTGPTGGSVQVYFAYADSLNANPPTVEPTGFNEGSALTTSKWIGTDAVNYTAPASPSPSGDYSTYEWTRYRTDSDPTTPTAVGTVTAAPGVLSVTLSWALPTYEGHDYSEVFKTAIGTYLGKSRSSSYTDTAVVPDTNYSYWVRHVNKDGTVSAKVAVTTKTKLSYDAATEWITDDSVFSNALTFNSTDVIFNADRFAIVTTQDTTPETGVPFSVNNGIVYMDNVYVRGTLEAHNIVNVDFDDMDTVNTLGSSTLGNTVVQGSFSVPPGSVTESMIDQEFIESLNRNLTATVSGGARSLDIANPITIGNYDIAFAAGVANVSDPIVSSNLQLTFSIDIYTAKLVPVGTGTPPGISVQPQLRKVGAGSWTNIGALINYAGYAVSAGSSDRMYLNINSSLYYTTARIVGDSYEYRVVLSSKNGDWWDGGVTFAVTMAELAFTGAGDAATLNLVPPWVSGNNWGVVPHVDNGGELSIGERLVFHSSDTQIPASGTYFDWVSLNVFETYINGIKCATFNGAGGGFDVNGALTATGNITAYSSDIRLKDVIAPLNNCIETINSWGVFSYTWNDIARNASEAFNHDRIEIGFAAQDIQKEYPEIIKPAPFDTKDGESISGEDYLTVQYEKTTPIIVGALQEALALISKLEERIERLETGN